MTTPASPRRRWPPTAAAWPPSSPTATWPPSTSTASWPGRRPGHARQPLRPCRLAGRRTRTCCWCRSTRARRRPAGRSCWPWTRPAGKTVWEKSRPVRSSWTTPIVIHARRPRPDHHGGRPLGHRLRSQGRQGALAGEVPAQGDVAPSPVFAAGMVYARPTIPPAPGASAPTAGRRDRDPHRCGRAKTTLPDTCSPLATDALRLRAHLGRHAHLLRRQEGREALGARSGQR